MIRFLEIFHDIAVDRPELTAVVDKEGKRSTSYGELDGISGRIASYLLSLGIKKESVVLISCPRGMELIAARLGVMKAGAAWVCVEEMMGQERIDYVIKDSGASVIFDLQRFLESQKMEILPFERWEEPSDHDLAFIIYTSGSTGNPMGAAQEYGVYDLILKGTFNETQDTEDYRPVRFANIIPETYVGGIHLTVGILQLPAELHIIPLSMVKDPEKLLKYFEDMEINVTFMPPTLAGTLLETGGLKLDGLHVGGEIVSGIYTDSFDVKNVYGLAEFGYPVSVFKLDKAYDITPVGEPFKGIKWVILDEDGNTDGKEGVFCVELPYFRGYTGCERDEKTVVIDGVRYFRTSDIVRVDEGVITILGREDHMIKLNGNRIDPAEIEAALKRVTGASFAAVKACFRGGVKFLAAYIPDDTVTDTDNVIKELKKYLPTYMIPSCFVRVKSLPVSENGKILKKDLPDPDTEDIRIEYAEPENEVQRKLCGLFEKVLEMKDKNIGIDDNFFLLGGDSLLAMKLIIAADIRDLTFKIIYEEQTVRKIDAALKRTEGREEKSGSPEESMPLSDKQRDFLEMQLSYPEMPLYNLPFVLYFNRDLQPERLKNAVDKAFRMHPGLFTVIRKKDGEWRRFMTPPEGEICGLREMSDKELDREISSLIKVPSFDGSPLYRAAIAVTPSRLALLIDINHIICDGTSLRILAEDVLSLYQGRVPEDDPYIELMNAEFREGCEENTFGDRDPFLKDYGNMLMRLPRPDLPGDRNVAEGIDREIRFNRKDILHASRKYGTAVSTVFMTAAAIALSRYNGVDRVLLSWIFNGRSRKESSRSVGMFLKYYPVAFRTGAGRDIESMLSEASERIREALASGREYPVMYRGHMKCMNYNYQGKISEDVDTDLLLELDDRDMGDIPTIEPFKVTIDDNEDGMELSIDYDAGLYLRSSMERFADIYMDSLRSIIEGRSGL